MASSNDGGLLQEMSRALLGAGRSPADLLATLNTPPVQRAANDTANADACDCPRCTIARSGSGPPPDFPFGMPTPMDLLNMVDMAGTCDCPRCTMARMNGMPTRPLGVQSQATAGPSGIANASTNPVRPTVILPTPEDLISKLRAHDFRDVAEEREALQALLDKADARKKADVEKRAAKRALYKTQGGSPFERLPPELLSLIVQKVLDHHCYYRGLGRGKKYTADMKRRDTLPLLKTLSLVCPSLLHVVRPRLFQCVRLIPLGEINADFARSWPYFSRAVRRMTCNLKVAPLLKQAENLQVLSLSGNQWKRNDKAVQDFLEALGPSRPTLRTFSFITTSQEIETLLPPLVLGSGINTLLPGIFHSLKHLTLITFRATLPWQQWMYMLDYMSELKSLKVLALTYCGSKGGYLPLNYTHALSALTVLRLSNMPEAECFLPGLLSRTRQLQRVFITGCHNFECARCTSGRLAHQWQQLEKEAEDAWEDIDDDDAEMREQGAESGDAFIDLSTALIDYQALPPPPQFPGDTQSFYDRPPLTSADKFGPLACRIHRDIMAIDLGKLKGLTLTDCSAWSQACSHFEASGLTHVAIKAQTRPINDDDLDVIDLIPFFESLPLLKTLRLPMQPDLAEDEDEPEEYYGDTDWSERRSRWEDGVMELEEALKPRGVKVIEEDELSMSMSAFYSM